MCPPFDNPIRVLILRLAILAHATLLEVVRLPNSAENQSNSCRLPTHNILSTWTTMPKPLATCQTTEGYNILARRPTFSASRFLVSAHLQGGPSPIHLLAQSPHQRPAARKQVLSRQFGVDVGPQPTMQANAIDFQQHRAQNPLNYGGEKGLDEGQARRPHDKISKTQLLSHESTSRLWMFLRALADPDPLHLHFHLHLLAKSFRASNLRTHT